MQLTTRTTCRVCGSTALTPAIDLGEQYLQGSFVKPGMPQPPAMKIPTALVRCDPTRDPKACGLLQMASRVPPEILYSVYWYRSGTNQTMRDHLRGIVEDATALVTRPRARVLDIGCNDGTLLSYYPKGCAKFGIDPSDASEAATGHDITVIRDLFPSEKLTRQAGGEPFDIITAIAMFYDLEDPVGFARQIKRILAPDGLWIIEMSYMPTMLRMNSYDTICHEHLEYYSLAVLEVIMGQAGLTIFRVSQNEINGGSIRCFVTHAATSTFSRSDRIETVRALREQEATLELRTDTPYREFQERINVQRTALMTLLTQLKREGKTIHVYGASTKGNTILQFCGIDRSLIDYAADRNPDKYGARTLGTDIPIISEAESRAMKPDYYLVLPWHFKKEFVMRERETLERGVGMIFTLPVVEIVTR